MQFQQRAPHLGHRGQLQQLPRAAADWTHRLPDDQRRGLLLKLGTATAVAAGRTGTPPPAAFGRGPAPHELTGPWASRYTYISTGRGTELEGLHRIERRATGGRLDGRSEPTETGTLELDLSTDGLLATGSWTERTSPSGYYRGAVYHGVVQFVLDPTGRSMIRWPGPDRHFTIDSGRWELHRTG